jgi:hypothetical protein
MSDVSHELERLAEADGATFLRSANGAWWARDRDGITIVRGALSRAEAARLYCEDKGLCGSTPEAILEYIKAQYRPYDTMLEFREGFEVVAPRVECAPLDAIAFAAWQPLSDHGRAVGARRVRDALKGNLTMRRHRRSLPRRDMRPSKRRTMPGSGSSRGIR